MIRPRLTRWLQGRAPRGPGPWTLTHQRVYILPTRWGGVAVAILGAMLVGSINYQINPGVALTFLLASALFLSLLHTHRNLTGIQVRALPPPSVFAGQPLRCALALSWQRRHPHHAIGASWADWGDQEAFADLPTADPAILHLEWPTRTRGWVHPGAVRVFTRHPLGLTIAWSWLRPEWRVLVFPRPDPGPLPGMEDPAWAGQGSTAQREGAGDFQGLRPYQPGDSTRRIHWKALAREDRPQTKRFHGENGGELWLDWHTLTALEPEQRLERLCHGVLWCHHQGLRFGLRLPGQILEPNQGPAHRLACLTALALYPGGSAA
ncbi:MAG: DUF58 domain-containing protein [Magnetococcus sp. WYHC-3]